MCLNDNSSDKRKSEKLFNTVRNLEVFTGESNRPQDSNAEVFYHIVGEGFYLRRSFSLLKGVGLNWFCSCNRSEFVDRDLFEHFSIYLALAYIKDEFPNIPIALWVDSENFLFNAYDGFYYDPNRHDCLHLQTFFQKLFDLIWELGIRDDDDIPVFANPKKEVSTAV